MPRGAGGWKWGTTKGGERQAGSLMQRQKSSPLSDEKGSLGEGHGRLTERQEKLNRESRGEGWRGWARVRGEGAGVGREGQAVKRAAAKRNSIQGTTFEINLFQLFRCSKV